MQAHIGDRGAERLQRDFVEAPAGDGLGDAGLADGGPGVGDLGASGLTAGGLGTGGLATGAPSRHRVTGRDQPERRGPGCLEHLAARKVGHLFPGTHIGWTPFTTP